MCFLSLSLSLIFPWNPTWLSLSKKNETEKRPQALRSIEAVPCKEFAWLDLPRALRCFDEAWGRTCR